MNTKNGTDKFSELIFSALSGSGMRVFDMMTREEKQLEESKRVIAVYPDRKDEALYRLHKSGYRVNAKHQKVEGVGFLALLTIHHDERKKLLVRALELVENVVARHGGSKREVVPEFFLTKIELILPIIYISPAEMEKTLSSKKEFKPLRVKAGYGYTGDKDCYRMTISVRKNAF